MAAPTSDLIIRQAVPAEAPALAAVLQAAFSEYRALYTPAAFAATTPTGPQIVQRMAEGPVWGAWLDGAAVGTVAAVPRGAGVYMRGMAVLPAARGRQVGAHLVAAVERFARAQGAAHIVLSTTPFLARAIRLYEQTGFTRSAAGPHDLAGTPLFTMIKRLDGATTGGAG